MPVDCGELLVVGFTGTSADEEWPARIRTQLSRAELGGVIPFRFNIQSRNQLSALIGGIVGGAPFKPFVMIDQEGGKVQRLSSANGFRDWFSAKHIATSLTLEEAEEHSYQMALMLKDVGINFNCAPCVDVDFDPPSPPIGKVERSYSSSPSTVADYGGAFVRGHRKAGVLTCAKHFPGHGSAQGDTHQGLVDITTTWSDRELEPYSNLLADGLLESVMVAHLVHSDIEPNLPAVFSPQWAGLLRDKIGFHGVVVSDDLHMGAIQSRFQFDEIVQRAFAGGCDIFMFSNNPLAAKGVENFKPNPEIPTEFAASVGRLVDSGTIPAMRVEESLRKVRALRAKIGF